MTIGDYSGTAGDAMFDTGDSYVNLNNMRFTTKDNDNDEHSSVNCATSYDDRGGWWYNSCMNANLNGINYNNGIADSYRSGILWMSSWSSDYYRSLKTVTMAIRPNNV